MNAFEYPVRAVMMPSASGSFLFSRIRFTTSVILCFLLLIATPFVTIRIRRKGLRHAGISRLFADVVEYRPPDGLRLGLGQAADRRAFHEIVVDGRPVLGMVDVPA